MVYVVQAMDEGDFYREMGLRMQRIRRKLGLTQEGLASMVSLTRTSIVNIEKGRQKVLAHTLVAIARSLRVAPAELLPDQPTIAPLDELLRGRPAAAQAFVRSAVATAVPQKRE